VLDSTIRELIDELAAEKAPPIYTLSPEEARNTLLRAQSGPVEKPEAQIKDTASTRRQARFVCGAFGPSASKLLPLLCCIFMVAAGCWGTWSHMTGW
jgi:hypothetical protein